jgi:curved DNA-binding protein
MERTQNEDLYEVLQVSPRAHPLIITKAFRLLAAIYHPDNKQTGDEEAFKQLGIAYHILSDPVRRAAYDRAYDASDGLANGPEWTDGNASAQLVDRQECDERELRPLILRALYDVRRGRPYKPGLSLLVLSELLGCSIESLQYTLWYLRGKRYIDTTDDSDLMISVEGVDYLEANGLVDDAPQSGGPLAAPTPLSPPLDMSQTSSLMKAPRRRGRKNGNGSNNCD